MTLDQLRVFVSVAQDQHVTRAASRLGISQSAASGTIAALETAHGVKLFDRFGRGICLTAAGRTFLPEAESILAHVERAARTLAEFAGLKTGTLRIQASETIASYWLPRHLVSFRAANGGISIQVAIGNSTEAVAAVLAGRAEIGFVEGPVAIEQLLKTTLAEDRLMVVVGPDHPFARRDRVGPDDLLDTEWVMRESGSGSRCALEDDLNAIGVKSALLRIALELPRNEAVVSAVAAGLGAAAISTNAVVDLLEDGALVRVPIDLPLRTFSMVRHGDREPSYAAAALIQMFRDKVCPGILRTVFD